MSSSREDSPDWLRCFQPPTKAAVTLLTSGSESPLSDGPPDEDNEDQINLSRLFQKDTLEKQVNGDNLDDGGHTVNMAFSRKSPNEVQTEEHTRQRNRKRKNHHEHEDKVGDNKAATRNALETSKTPHEHNHSICTLYLDSESSPDPSPEMEGNFLDRALEKEPLVHDKAQYKNEEDNDLEESLRKNSKGKSPRKSPRKQLKNEDHKPTKETKGTAHMNGENNGDVDTLEENALEKHGGTHVSSSRLPLMLTEKVQRSKALVECEGDSMDLSGDVGAVGRIVIAENACGNHEMLLDLKGTIYKTAIVPSRTFCVIDAIMNDFIQLKPQSNVYEAETMVEGTLDGFSFDAEDEADNLPKISNQTDQSEAVAEKSNGNTKRKAEKTSGSERRKGKAAGGKLAKKIKKKSQLPRKTKAKK